MIATAKSIFIQRTGLIFTLVGLAIGSLLSIPDTISAQTAMTLIDHNTFTDQTGRKFNIKRPFKRIISLYGAHTENLYALGADDLIIGVGSHQAYPPKAKAKKVYSYRDDAEKFLAAQPDLILIRSMISRAYPGLIARMEQSGICVVSLQPANLFQMYDYWRILGILTGKKHTADKMVTAFQGAVKAYQDLTHPIAPKKRVYLEAIHDKMKTFTPDAMAAAVLKLAGGLNVASDAPQVRRTNIAFYGKERILSKADQIDLYLAQFGTMNRPTIAMIKNEPGFDVIKAVRENQIFIIDEAIISRPTPRLLKGIYTMGRILYPARFKHKGQKILRSCAKTPFWAQILRWDQEFNPQNTSCIPAVEHSAPP
jgi:iron complex transport system substrate-binding protein